MMRFASLGSGSRGNANLVVSNNTILLVDCGFTVKETEIRLALAGIDPHDIDAILVTHEHGDHIRGVGALSRKYQIPTMMTHGTAQHDGLGRLPQLHIINCQREFVVGDIAITPVIVPHDAREPCQFVFQCAKRRLGLLTDLGTVTPHVVDSYRHCDALMLECNHDSNMLAMGPYPVSLKRRVGGQWGHLNNRQSAGLLEQIETARLQHLVISHISETNNTAELALAAVLSRVSSGQPVLLATQNTGFDWLAVN